MKLLQSATGFTPALMLSYIKLVVCRVTFKPCQGRRIMPKYFSRDPRQTLKDIQWRNEDAEFTEDYQKIITPEMTIKAKSAERMGLNQLVRAASEATLEVANSLAQNAGDFKEKNTSKLTSTSLVEKAARLTDLERLQGWVIVNRTDGVVVKKLARPTEQVSYEGQSRFMSTYEVISKHCLSSYDMTRNPMYAQAMAAWKEDTAIAQLDRQLAIEAGDFEVGNSEASDGLLSSSSSEDGLNS
jgi:hypothetical protein